MPARVGQSARRYSRGGALLGVLAVAVGVGSIAYTAGMKAAPRPYRQEFKVLVPEYNVVEVPVPERPVAAGTVMREVRVRMEKFPEHQLPAGAVRNLTAVRERVALVALPGGLPIVEGNLGGAEDLANPIMGRIPPGMRAMTVKVDATASVEGWVRGGSIVDVLLIEKSKTTVIAEQVKVISAERSLSPSGAGPQVVPNTVTLLVTQEQCLAIHTAVPLGKIAFALRSLNDEEGWRATRFSSEELVNTQRDPDKERVGGVVEFGSGGDRKRYALVDGAWIPADSVPTGFFIDSKQVQE